MGLSEDVDKAIRRIQTAIALANALRLALIGLEAASGPIGWGFAIVGAASFALDLGAFVESEGRGR